MMWWKERLERLNLDLNIGYDLRYVTVSLSFLIYKIWIIPHRFDRKKKYKMLYLATNLQ